MTDTSSLGFILPLAVLPFFITGFIGNVLVIRIIHKTRQMHTTTNYLLANLAVSNVLAILLPVFSIFASLANLDDSHREFFCKFTAISSIPIFLSSFTLTLLAVERYHALLKPFRTGLRLNQGNIKRAIATVWISSILFCFPMAFLLHGSKTSSKCVLAHKEVAYFYFIIMCLVSTYIPLAIFLFCYGSLIKGLYFTQTICATDTADQDRSAEKKKLVITFILATAGFVIGYGPVVVYETVMILSDGEKIQTLETVFKFILFSSLCLNPILYAFRSTNFQEGFKRIIFCRETLPANEIQPS